MSDATSGNKRKWRYRKQAHDAKGAKKRKGNSLESGDKGFLITCQNGNESRATKEACDLLNEYADKFYGPVEQETSKPHENETQSDDDDDLELALKEECSRLKQDQKFSNEQRRFAPVECTVKNCCFVKTTLNDEKPSTLAYKILKDLKETNARKCRFVQRFLPADVTCKTSEKDIADAAKNLIENEFASTSSSVTYAVEFKSRNSDLISKELVYEMFGDLIAAVNPNVRVNLSNPDKTILVDVLCKICCMSVVDEYQNLRRYNVHEVVVATSSDK